MKPIDFIIIAIVACIALAIIAYLYKRKKAGAVCVGCPYAKQCASSSPASGGTSGCSSGCSCGGSH